MKLRNPFESLRTPKEKQRRVDSRRQQEMDRTVLMRLNKFLANPKILVPVSILFGFALFLLGNYLMNFVIQGLRNVRPYFAGEVGISEMITWRHMFTFHIAPLWLYLVLVLLSVFLAWRFGYQVRTAFKDNNVGQKGVERWTTVAEIKQQYRSVPERAKPIEGKGGTIISRIGHELYIDDSPGHNLLYGGTRSGKTQMYVKPMIDMNSRCSEKPSFVITDVKLELAPSCKATLEERGYAVYVVNLLNPYYSSGYNPLSIVIEAYKAGRHSDAEMLSRAFSFSLFSQELGKSGNQEQQEYWSNTATDLLSALIIAHVEDCLNLDKNENAAAQYEFLQKQRSFADLSEADQEEVRRQYRDGETTAERCDFIPTQFTFKASSKYEKQLTIYSILNSFILLAEQIVNDQGQTALDLFFENRPNNDRARTKYASIKIAGYKTKASAYSNMLAKLTALNYEEIAKLTAESSFALRDIGFGDTPVAVFLGIPDYDKSMHFLATVFIRQTYFVLAKEAAQQRDGRCTRPVRFLLEEFGNLPPMENMENIATIGAGRNMFMDIIIQSFAQMETKYGETAKIIRDNCQNLIYIKSSDPQTNESFSKLIGSETITNINRIGKKLQFGKTFTEQYDERPLLNPNELKNLQEGECVVVRMMKRTDLQGNPCTPTPIFNTGPMRMKYAYQYLSHEFPSNVRWEDVANDTRQHIDIEEIRFDIVKWYNLRVAERNNTRYMLCFSPFFPKLIDMVMEDGIEVDIAKLQKRQMRELFHVFGQFDLPEDRMAQYRESLMHQIEHTQKRYATLQVQKEKKKEGKPSDPNH